MEPSRITLKSICPFVRYAQEIQLSKPRKMAVAYDHRLFFAVSGGGMLKISETEHRIQPGAVLYIPSGNPYALLPDPDGDLHLMAVNFDCTQAGTENVLCIPMGNPQEYDPEKRMEVLCFTDVPKMNEWLHLDTLPGILPCLQAILREMAVPDHFSTVQTGHWMALILNQIGRSVFQEPCVRQRTVSFREILEYIQLHYQEPLDNRTLGRIFHYHENYVNQLFTEHTGIPVHQYLLKVRIRQALELLQNTDLPVREIAVQVGFRDCSYFSQYFKKITGYSPSAFRLP